MIRLLQRRLIIPRGDTGSFTVPLLSQGNTDNIAVFTIFDELTRTRLFQKIIQCEGDVMNVVFTHNDTVNLKPGKYLWDIKFYQNPQFVDEELVNGDEVDSYYAGFSLPVCEIRETADNYLVSPDAPTAMLTPEQLDIITGAINSLNEAIEKTQSNVEHYPIVRDEVWYTWDAETQDYVSTGVRANGIVGPAGTGISSVVLNDDYTLTLNLTDGTSFTSTSIRGEVGNGIDDIVLNSDYTLSIRYTDGEVYTTPSIRGEKGDPGDVSSVAGKTGIVTLDAGDIEYDEQEVYNSGTVGKEVGDLKSQITDLYAQETATDTGEIILTGNNQITDVGFDGEASSVIVRNEQLFEANYPSSNNQFGLNITKNNDGSYTIDGVATSGAWFHLNKSSRTGTDNPFAINGKYSLTAEIISGTVEKNTATSNDLFLIGVKDGSSTSRALATTYNASGSYTPTDTQTVSVTNTIVAFRATTGVKYNSLRLRFMLNKGDPRAWIKYKTPVTVTSPFDNVVSVANSFIPDVYIIANDASTIISVDYLVTPQEAVDKVESELSAEISTNASNIEGTNDRIDTIRYKSNIICANHRGYHNGYPENTLWAFAQSKLRGFDWIENDVRFTSDGVGVLLHDETINRTARNADGTTISGDVYISDITYAQALEYDFGVYAGAEFAGTKIVTVEECVSFCKNVGLGIVMEPKNTNSGTYCANIVKKYAMEDRVLWISFTDAILREVNAVLPSAKIGLLTGLEPSSTFINKAIALKTTTNSVFVGLNYTYSIADYKADLISNDIGYSVYTLDSTAALDTLDPYCFEITSNVLIANNYLAKNALQEWTP